MRSNSPAFRARTLALSAALAALAACAPLPGRMSVGLVYVDQAPPPRRVEVVPVHPGPEFVWIDGYWGWTDRAYAWVPGRWARPPRLRAHWVPGHWRREHRGWYWQPGRWR